MSDEQPQQTTQQPTPEWIPVPPPNPFAGGGVPAGRGLGIAAMAIGLVAVLTTIMAAIYLPLAVALGAILGLVAIVFGIIALVKRQRPRGTGITGLASGALTVLIALGLAAFGLGNLAVATLSEVPPTAQPESDWGAEDTDPPATLIEWPANMRTGGILFESGLLPRSSEPLPFGEAPATTEVDRSSGVLDIRLYVDYRCPYCGLFEQQNGDMLTELVSDGAVTVELVPLTFLDRSSEGSYYSSRAAAAMACVADGQPDAAWAAHTTLLSPEVQPAATGAGLSNEEIIAQLDRGVGGLSNGVAECITSERFVPFAQALNNWVFSVPVPNAVDPQLGVSSTPFIVANGIPYTGDPSDNTAFRTFLAQLAGY